MRLLIESEEICLSAEEQFELHKKAVMHHLLHFESSKIAGNIRHHLEGMERAFRERHLL